MSAFNKQQEFAEAAEKAEKEFLAQFQPDESEAEPEKVTEPDSNPVAEAEPTPEPEPEPPQIDEEKYKAHVKAMNAAQRKVAELAKREEELNKRLEEQEAKLKEALEAAKARQQEPRQPDPEDEWEADMPEVTKIAQRKAAEIEKKMQARLDAMEASLKAQEEFRQKIDAEASARKLREDIAAAHPDYDKHTSSEEMVAWINNEAPPIYKAIFEGSIPFTAKDAIAVLNAYKSTLAPTQQASKQSPSAADVGTSVKSNPNISTKNAAEKPVTEKEMEWFMHNSHKLKPEELAEWDRRLSAL